MHHLIGTSSSRCGRPTTSLRGRVIGLRAFAEIISSAVPAIDCSLASRSDWLATPSSHESTFETVTVCSSSGAFTRIVKRVPGASGISASTLCLNAAIASAAASNRLSAGTPAECR